MLNSHRYTYDTTAFSIVWWSLGVFRLYDPEILKLNLDYVCKQSKIRVLEVARERTEGKKRSNSQNLLS